METPNQPPAVPHSPESLATQKKVRFWKRVLIGSALGVLIPPILGLAGTLIGMADAFRVLEETGEADPEELAQGISIALLTTVWGLIFALVGLICLILASVRLRLLRKITVPAASAPDDAAKKEIDF